MAFSYYYKPSTMSSSFILTLFLHSLMDLALFLFCFPLEPWNSPSGEKAIAPDASLHFVNIVRSFHPLSSVCLLFSLVLYIVWIVSSAHWIDSSVTLKKCRRAMKHVIILKRFPASFWPYFLFSLKTKK